MPRPTQGEQAVEHAPPTRRPEHQAEEHPEQLQPLRQGRVEQVVRTSPDVDEDQGPEVNDRQFVAVDGAVRLFRDKVVHHAKETRC